MSYTCLMVNENGAVAAADTRETFSRFFHLNWRRKCFSLPEKQLVWACCGPSLRYGVSIFSAVRRILRSQPDMEQGLAKVGKLVAALTRVRLGRRDDPGVFCLLAAQWEEGAFTVWNYSVRDGKPALHKTRLAPGGVMSLHAGAYHRQMPPLDPQRLVGLSYDQLAKLARDRVELAIQMDRERKLRDRKHNQTIGGRVRLEGLRLSRPE